MTKTFDPIADFARRWPSNVKPITNVMAGLRKVSEAQARKLKAQTDLEDAMRELFEAEAELEFMKQITTKKN